VAVTALVLAGCGSDDGDESTGGEATTETTAGESTETGPATTEAPSSDPTTSSSPEDGGESTTAPDTGTDLAPGDPCSLEEGVADCIDPDGDGEGTYLTDGDECAATAPDISVCEDLDGDGVAGYPDEFEDLPTCSDEVPPPCNNEPGSQEE
jgi:hypothetical protein